MESREATGAIFGMYYYMAKCEFICGIWLAGACGCSKQYGVDRLPTYGDNIVLVPHTWRLTTDRSPSSWG